jgi:hypothetical protein
MLQTTGIRARVGGLAVLMAAVVFATTATIASAAPAAPWVETPHAHVGTNANEIHAMVATGDDDVWAFGFDRAYVGGAFEWRVLGLHWNGFEWTRVNTLDRETAPAQDFIWGADASGPNDVWIVGSSKISGGSAQTRTLVEHWDGENWSIDNTVTEPGARPTLLAVSARTPNDVWAVGETVRVGVSDYSGYVVHRTATGWVEVPFTHADVPGCTVNSRGELNAVEAVAENDVYVAGWCANRGFVKHWNGTAWSLTLTAPDGSQLRELAVAPDGAVWVAGNRDSDSGVIPGAFPLVFHGNAASGWTRVPVRHGATFGGSIDSLLATAKGVVIAGQLSDPRVSPSPPQITYALRLGPDGKWRKEATVPQTGYARVHAAAVEPDGTEWLGGTAVGGQRLDPQSLMLTR